MMVSCLPTRACQSPNVATLNPAQGPSHSRGQVKELAVLLSKWYKKWGAGHSEIPVSTTGRHMTDEPVAGQEEKANRWDEGGRISDSPLQVHYLNLHPQMNKEGDR